MNKDLQSILNIIQQSQHLSDEEKNTLSKAAKDANKELEITSFKLDRTEKVKKTTAILLEETIAELEQKRKAVEAQNKELEIESSLERVRTVAMSMNKPDDMLHVCHIISDQLELLNVKEIRNVQTAIFYQEKGTYMNYEYYAKHDKTSVTETSYTNHKIHQEFADRMLKGNGEFMIAHIKGDEVKDWIAYQKTTNVFIDDYLNTASSLNYYWYSLGPVALGISTYSPLNEDETNLFKRFLKVFELSYRRYLDIEKAEAQAHEARVEGSLEKVRAVAMSMNKPDDLLNICETLYKEFSAFGFADLRNAMINIHDDEKKTFVNYDYSDEIGKSTNHLAYNIHPVIEKQIAQVRSSNDAFSETVFAGEDLDDWKKFRKEIGEKDDPRINKSAALYYYFYSIGTGSIGISTFSLVSDKKIILLKRFRNVFNLSYQRYTDLALAEAQAREAQIQLAMERVRARTMAMQKSDELKQAATLLFQQVKSLGAPAYSCGYNIWEKNEKEFTSWMSTQDGTDISGVPNIPLTEDPNFIRYVESKQKGEPFFVLELRGERMQEHYQYLKTIPAFKGYFDYAVSVGFDLPETQIHHVANFSQGNLLFITLEPCPEFHDVFKRFAAVFEQTYTRFLDLQNAEAQARESQIQLALERIRARTMAMQKSDELAETASLLFKQLLALGIKSTQMRTCAITTLKPDEPIGECWITKLDGDIIPRSFMVPYNETSAYKTIYAAWKNGEKFLVVNLSGDALVQHLNFLKKYAKIPTQQFQALPDQPTETFTHAMFFSQGYLFIISNEPLPEYHEIFKRFGAIFQQTYTRFLDLKKAEAQSREAQIELGLERVRARAMAMQKSEELAELVDTVFKELTKLDFALTRCILWIMSDKSATTWMANPEINTPESFNIKYPDHPYYKALISAWKERKPKWMYELKGDEKRELNNLLFDETEASRVPDEVKAAMMVLEKVILSFSFHNFGGLQVDGLELLSDEHMDILYRFGRVFDLTYTRFSDLKQAEAQARESQIQLALERVRARTMAMQKSEELSETVFILFQQFKQLGENPDQATIGIINEEKWVIEYWVTMYGNQTTRVYKFPIDEPNVTNRIYKAWREQKKSLVIELGGKELYDFSNFRESMGGAAYNEKEKKRVINVAFFSKGLLNVQSNEFRSAESIHLLERFAKVFEQTYTRFLDLKKAEAQAREAQIEAALEKVRSSSLAMHKSTELNDIVMVLFEKLKDLQIPVTAVGITIYIEGSKNMNMYVCGNIGNGLTINSYLLPYFDHRITNDLYEVRKNSSDFFVGNYSKQEKDSFYEYAFKYSALKDLPGEIKTMIMQSPSYSIAMAPAKHSMINLNDFEGKLLSENEKDVLKRFSKVFEQTYIRFLDLQKAEAQAHESQIQLALERVRARTMAMQHSSELQETALLLFQQILTLGVSQFGCGFNIWDDDRKAFTAWMGGGLGEKTLVPPFKVSSSEDIFLLIYEAAERGESLFVKEQVGEELETHYRYMNSMPVWKEIMEGVTLPTFQVIHCAFFSQGFLIFISPEPIPEAHDIFKRFAKVFEQTYTRFLDLQKAEAQVREAQIEAALERVRSKTMAMHNSNDLANAAGALFTELNKLGIKPIRTGFVLLTKDSRRAKLYPAASFDDQNTVLLTGEFDFTGHPLFEKQYEAWQNKENYFPVLENEEQLRSYYKVLTDNLSVLYENVRTDKKQFGSFLPFSEGFLFTWSDQPYSESEINVLIRFRSILDLTIRRFLDIQKAEAQTRESQIQLALERVRAKTMAMHSSEDVTSAAETMFEELKKLGINCLRGGIANIRNDKTMDVFGITNMDGETMSGFSFFDMNLHPLWQSLFESWNNKEEIFIGYLAGKEKEDYLNIVNTRQNYLPQSIVEFPDTNFQAYRFDQGAIWTYSLQPHNEADREIMKRFACGFALTFRRYQDLKKAEAQAREAQIEAALERVRSKAMSMQKSEDLSNAVAIVFDELEKMDLGAIRCGISIINKEDHTTKIWSTTKTAEGTAVQVSGYESMDIHPLLKGAFSAWSQLKDFSYVLKDDDLTNFYTALSNTNFKLPGDQAGLSSSQQHMYVSHFPVGGLYVFNESEFSEDVKKIIKRFGEVFNLTYTRYNDLQIAEASAREAIRQAALDRIRADIASMRTTKDLERITPLIWNELNILEVPFIRCGVFIMNDEQQHIQTFLSTPDGKAIAAFHIPYDTPGNIKQVISHWNDHKNYIDHWDEDAFTTFAETLVKQGALTSPEQYLQTIPHGGFYLHFLPFLQGMLYVGNTTQLSEDETDLIQSIADAFSTAYARYEDFNKLESAKQQIEKTLVDLKQAQSQLIQSEKMASLGELTAGIAHEIQNPLNFVNNFSEVNKELIEEIIEERNKPQGTRDEKLENEILNDIKANEEKINHHGKRADAIVKGMLQHSRSSTSQKEPTDINALADEYLRLAFHGLRAKDNLFNATIKTDFDESIEKINIIPQDIGRVLLNLYNNAFYALAEKSKLPTRDLSGFESLTGLGNFEPTISISTKKSENGISITVSDNGNGIPRKVVDKIFQPFFTTKPTGQGTGLGLSLSYDIIKAHGGDIKVETKEGEGTTFIIQLPV